MSDINMNLKYPEIIEIDCCLVDFFKNKCPEKCGLIQQMNCFHIQGGGIALRIRNEFPQVMKADIDFAPRGDRKKMGKFCVVEVLPDKFCYGMYSQFDLGMAERHTNYEAMYVGLKAIEADAFKRGLAVLCLPRNMGCTLGGGDWRIVRSIIDVVFEKSTMDVVICNYTPNPYK